MLPILIPAAVVTVATIAYFRRPKDYGVMTEERKKAYKNALSGAVKEPEVLEKLGKAFELQGLKEQAKLLYQRASLRRLPVEVKRQRKEIFRRLMESKDKAAVLSMAEVYDADGCTNAAQNLRNYASGLPDNIEDIQT